MSCDMQRIKSMPQSFRFLLAGGASALLSWLARFPLSLVMPFPAAVALATAISMVFGFGLYRHFVFPGSDRALASQMRDYTLINLASMAIVTGVAVVFADHVMPLIGFDWHNEAIAHAIGISAGAVSNFFGHRFLSFRQPDPVTEPRAE
jgi:putative flippase GtrA